MNNPRRTADIVTLPVRPVSAAEQEQREAIAELLILRHGIPESHAPAVARRISAMLDELVLLSPQHHLPFDLIVCAAGQLCRLESEVWFLRQQNRGATTP